MGMGLTCTGRHCGRLAKVSSLGLYCLIRNRVALAGLDQTGWLAGLDQEQGTRDEGEGLEARGASENLQPQGPRPTPLTSPESWTRRSVPWCRVPMRLECPGRASRCAGLRWWPPLHKASTGCPWPGLPAKL